MPAAMPFVSLASSIHCLDSPFLMDLRSRSARNRQGALLQARSVLATGWLVDHGQGFAVLMAPVADELLLTKAVAVLP